MDFSERRPRINVGVGITVASKSNNAYEYIKPVVSMEIDVLYGEDPLDVMDELTQLLIDKLDNVAGELDYYVSKVS